MNNIIRKLGTYIVYCPDHSDAINLVKCKKNRLNIKGDKKILDLPYNQMEGNI